MSLPRVRFTVRRMMVAVAVAAVLMGIVSWLVGRSRSCWALTRHHVIRLARTATYVGSPRRVVLTDSTGRVVSPEANLWHGTLAEKYAHAARYPWLPVVPDPPEPK